MDTNEKEIALVLLDMVSKKREEIKTLTSEIMELENDPKNIERIKQKVYHVVNEVASLSKPKNDFLEILHSSAESVFTLFRLFPNPLSTIAVAGLERFCILANTWNPIEFDFNKKGLKIEFRNVNISGININELKNRLTERTNQDKENVSE